MMKLLFWCIVIAIVAKPIRAIIKWALGFLPDDADDWIDNSDQNVYNRLNYLRLPKEVYPRRYISDKLPEEVTVLPRKISYSINAMEFFVCHDAYDDLNYPFDCDQIFEILKSKDYYNIDFKDRRFKEMVDHSSAYVFCSSIYPDPDSEQTILPITRKEFTGDKLDCPEELKNIFPEDDPEEYSCVINVWVLGGLESDSWRAISFDYSYPSGPAPQRDYLEPRYRDGVCVEIDLRINGIPADKCNLTFTEQATIRRMITNDWEENKNTSRTGYFESDGKELYNDIPSDVEFYVGRHTDGDNDWADSVQDVRERSHSFGWWYGLRLDDDEYEKKRQAISS